MKELFDFLSSDFGVLISGAVIDGFMIQYVTTRGQRRSWIPVLSDISVRFIEVPENESEEASIDRQNNSAQAYPSLYASYVSAGELLCLSASKHDTRVCQQ